MLHQQCVQAVPANLDADTEQDERGEAHYHAGSGRPQFAENAIGVAVAEVDTHGDDQDAKRVGWRLSPPMGERPASGWPRA